MIEVTQAWKDVAENSSAYDVWLTIVLKNGGRLVLSPEHVMMGTATWQNDMTSVGNFQMGAVISNQFSVTLNNNEGDFDEVDFEDAKIYVEVSNDSDEYISMGVYYVFQRNLRGKTIQITAYDMLSRLDSYEYEYIDDDGEIVTVDDTYYENAWSVGDSALDAVNAVLRCYGKQFPSFNPFPNHDHTLTVAASDAYGTPREMLGWILEIIGCYAYCDNNGGLCIEQIKRPGIVTEGIDYGAFSPWDTETETDYGTFEPWSSTDAKDFGELYEVSEAYPIKKIYGLPSIAFHPYRVTGVLVKYDADNYAKKGKDGGIYYVADNPLVTTKAEAQSVADMIYGAVGDINFYPFSADIMTDPTIEVGDPIYIEDEAERKYTSIITSYRMTVGQLSTISFEADQYGERSFAETWRKVKG